MALLSHGILLITSVQVVLSNQYCTATTYKAFAFVGKKKVWENAQCFVYIRFVFVPRSLRISVSFTPQLHLAIHSHTLACVSSGIKRYRPILNPSLMKVRCWKIQIRGCTV